MLDLGSCTVFGSKRYACDLRRNSVGKPGRICDHGAVIVGHRLYVAVGGYGYEHELALYCCDLVGEEWRSIPLDGHPASDVEVFNMFIYNDSLVVWTKAKRVVTMRKVNCLLFGRWALLADLTRVEEIGVSKYVQGAFHEGRAEAFLYDGSEVHVIDVEQNRSVKPKTKGQLRRNIEWRLVAAANVLVFVGKGFGRIRGLFAGVKHNDL